MHQTLGPKGPPVEFHPPPKLYKSYFCCKQILLHSYCYLCTQLLHHYCCCYTETVARDLLLLLQSYYLHS